MTKDIPADYSPKAQRTRSGPAGFATQITSGARTVLLVLLAASALVFIIACSNVANLILTRTVRREGELAIRAGRSAQARSGAAAPWMLAETPFALRRRRRGRCMERPAAGGHPGPVRSRFSVRRARLTVDSSLSGRSRRWPSWRGDFWRLSPLAVGRHVQWPQACPERSVRITGSTSRRSKNLRGVPNRCILRAADRRK